MFCSKCGKKIPDESNYCLFCGFQLNTNEESQIEEKPLNQKEIRYEKAMQWISENYLKSPSTASWPKYDDSMIEFSGLISTNRFIQTYIDSVNSYGAMIRTYTRLKIDDNNNILSFAFKNPHEFIYGLYRDICI